jgi:hypothetical protein
MSTEMIVLPEIVSRGTAPERTGPFKGLDPYSEQDADIFFSRDEEKDLILGNLMAARLLLLYGPSGVGKSSIVRAGILHEVHKIVASNRDATGVPELAIAVVDTWRDDPVGALKTAVAAAVRTAMADVSVSPPASELSLCEYLAQAAERVGGELFIVLDQFEEYFAYHAHHQGDGSFYREFPRAVNDLSLPVHFLVSLREDGLADLDLFKQSIPNLFVNRYRLNYLTAVAASAAIAGAVARFNELTPAAKVEIGKGLVARVVADVKIGRVEFAETGQAGREESGGRIATPYLQLVMQRLWDEEMKRESRVLRLETLQDPPEQGLGGVERIVRAHLDEKLSILSPEQQEVAAQILRFLVTRSGTKYAYSIQDLADREQTGLPADRIAEVVEKLSKGDARIFDNIGPPPHHRAEPEPARSNASGAGVEDRYQIYHDVLAPAALDWRRRYVERQEQEKVHRDEIVRRDRSRLAMLRWGLVAMSVALILLLGVTMLAVTQRQRAAMALMRAQEARASALSEQASAQNALLRSVEQQNSYAKVLDAISADDPTVLRRALATLDSSEARLIQVDTSGTGQRRVIPVVYLQFQGSLGRELMDTLRERLYASGVAAPGAQRIIPAFNSEVRYFFEEDEEAATRAAQATMAFFRQRNCPIELPLRRIRMQARPGQVEVWVSTDCPRANTPEPAE